jgi:hypothetical protein
MTDALPPAGYYPDPAGSGHQRYWDGARWTAHLTPGARPAPTVTTARLASLQPSAGRSAILPDAVMPATIVRKRPPLRISRIAFGVFLVVGTTVAGYVNTHPVGASAAGAAVHSAR